MKKIFLFVSFVFFIFSSVFAQFRKAPYMIYPDNNTQMDILWQTSSTINCTIEWGLTQNFELGLQQTTENNSTTNGHIHKFTIGNLIPAQHYFFSVIAGTETYQGDFIAAPTTAETNISFFLFGDSRSFPDRRNLVSNAILNYIGTHSEFQTFIFHSGDFVNKGNCEADWDNQFFAKQYTGNINLSLKLPLMGVRGNHELVSCFRLNRGSEVYYKYFPFNYSQTGASYYSFKYGPIELIVLDQYSDISVGSIQYNWLVNKLQNKTTAWQFIMVHAPGYSDGIHVNEPEQLNIQSIVAPLCKIYGVKVIAGGHNHYYSHCLKDGIHHLTLGGAGAPGYNPAGNSPYLVKSEKTLHFAAVQIAGNSCTFTIIREDGSVVETFTLTNTTSIKQLNKKFIITPNPTASILRITAQMGFNIEKLEIFDIKGKLMFSEEYKDLNETNISISEIKKGIYFLRINSKGVIRFIKK